MIAYIVKSSLTLLLLFGLYWFLLRKEKLFIFNRFFLVLSVVFSLILPFISIPVNFQPTQNLEKIITTFDNNIPDNNPSLNNINQDLNQSFDEVQPSRINISKILLILYTSGVVVFLFRFLKNIYFIFILIKSSEKINYPGCRIVLTDNQTNPYCFFNSIFMNKHEYLNDNIDKSLLNHELEHVRQSHSIDIVFIELIKIFYWFNPVLLLYNRAIRINHEYLADNGVIRNYHDIKSYSDKLLSFIICNNNIPLTSGFNHSLTKKRLVMMTKSRSKNINASIKIVMTLSLILVFSLTISFKQSEPQSIKMVFVPQGQFNSKIIIGSDTLRDATISVDAFLISNEITNKEYREFTDWTKKNTNDTLYQANYTVSVVNDNKRGVTKDTIIKKLTPIKISDILNDLIDLSALYKLDNKYKDYFTDKRYDDYPVVGVSKKMAEYYCIWKTDTENKIRLEQGLPKNHNYRLPLELEWEYVAQQSSDNINKSKKVTSIEKSGEGIPDIWGLTHLDDNVSEWVTSSKETNGIVRGGSWKTDANITERQIIDPNSKEGYIGFRIVQSYLSPLPSVANPAAHQKTEITAKSVKLDAGKAVMDTVLIHQDSLITDTILMNLHRPSLNTIDKEGTYIAAGYIKRDIINKEVVALIGEAVVKYGEIEIKADSIVFNIRTYLLFAVGRLDKSGKIIGKPVFKEGAQEFEADELTYNFKTHKCLIKNIKPQEIKVFQPFPPV